MVGVQLIPLPRIVGENNARPRQPNLPAHLRSQRHRVLELAVDVVEMHDMRRTEHA